MQEIVTESLREAVLRGQLRPGERLDQAEIAERFHVSRMPVREALRTLEAEGLVRFYPHRGVVVNDLSPEEIEEVYSIRIALESMAVRLAIPRLTPLILGELDGILGEMDLVKDDRLTWAVLNHRFHSRLYSASGQARLCGIIDTLRNTVQPYVIGNVSHAERAARAAEEHRELLSLCRHGDVPGAENMVRQHLRNVCDGLLQAARG
jgi:DNA-binding GntR family transcriptional regulator